MAVGQLFGAPPPGTRRPPPTPYATSSTAATSTLPPSYEGDESRIQSTGDQHFGHAQSQFDNLLNDPMLQRFLGPSGSMNFGGNSGSGAPPPPAMWTPTPPTMPTVKPVDTTASDAAAFAKAKDTVGKVSSGAVSGLRSALGASGMLGSGREGRATANVVNEGAGQLGDVARGLAETSAKNAQTNALANYQGEVSMFNNSQQQNLEREKMAQEAQLSREQMAQQMRIAGQSNNSSRLASILGLWKSLY